MNQWTVPTKATSASSHERRRLLAVYLRDHFAGATAGVALARRCRRANAGTEYEALLTAIETEIDEDRDTLTAMMSDLEVKPSRIKSAIGSIAELLGRLKTNGRLVRYSPSSRVVELEGIAAGIITKRSLWRALQTIAGDHRTLDSKRLDELIERATSQHDRVVGAHCRAAAEAFAEPRADS